MKSKKVWWFCSTQLLVKEKLKINIKEYDLIFMELNKIKIKIMRNNWSSFTQNILVYDPNYTTKELKRVEFI